jgi:hypothetical protein
MSHVFVDNCTLTSSRCSYQAARASWPWRWPATAADPMWGSLGATDDEINAAAGRLLMSAAPAAPAPGDSLADSLDAADAAHSAASAVNEADEPLG